MSWPKHIVFNYSGEITYCKLAYSYRDGSISKYYCEPLDQYFNSYYLGVVDEMRASEEEYLAALVLES